MIGSALQMFSPAKTLSEIHKTISGEPLLENEEYEAFYRPQMNNTRGNDRMGIIEQGLKDSRAPHFFKAFLFGHRGVGKSTELTRLCRQIGDRFSVIRFSVERELDVVNFQPFDVLLYMLVAISEQCVLSVSQGGADGRPPEALLQKIWNWFGAEKETIKKATELGAEMAAGAGVEPGSIWAKMLGLFARFKAEIRYTATREQEVERYRLSRLSELIDLTNEFLNECNNLLRGASGREWLIIGEDFDRYYIGKDQTERLFITYGSILKSLRTHLIFTIPVELEYSRAAELPFERYILPDTPVYGPAPDHEPHAAGRDAIRAVLEARVNADLFAPRQIDRLIVASGGNLRDLFTMTAYAARVARLRKNESGRIEAEDVDASVNEMRSDYKTQLGVSDKDDKAVTTDKKIEKLLALYHGKPRCDIPDLELLALLRCRAVQEFNAKRWFGIHPLVVDYLASQGSIPRPSQQEPVRGGLI